MFGFALSPIVRVVVIVLFIASVIAGIYYKGRLDERKLFDAYKAEVKAVAKAQQDKIDTMKKVQSQITKKAEVDHEKSLSNLRGIYSTLRVRQPASSCGMSEVPDTATKPAEATAHYLSVAPELAVGCAETTQQLVDLQGWIKDQGEVQ